MLHGQPFSAKEQGKVVNCKNKLTMPSHIFMKKQKSSRLSYLWEK